MAGDCFPRCRPPFLSMASKQFQKTKRKPEKRTEHKHWAGAKHTGQFFNRIPTRNPERGAQTHPMADTVARTSNKKSISGTRVHLSCDLPSIFAGLLDFGGENCRIERSRARAREGSHWDGVDQEQYAKGVRAANRCATCPRIVLPDQFCRRPHRRNPRQRFNRRSSRRPPPSRWTCAPAH